MTDRPRRLSRKQAWKEGRKAGRQEDGAKNAEVKRDICGVLLAFVSLGNDYCMLNNGMGFACFDFSKNC